MKAIRKRLGKEEALERSYEVCRNIMNMKQYKCAEKVLLYNSICNEVDTKAIIKNCFDTGKQVFLPVITENNNFEARRYIKSAKMTINKFGIPEPKEGMTINPKELDLIIAPGIAFDKRLHRIGFGSGYYDRYLKKTKNAYTIGAAYLFQIVDIIKESGHDICLDAVATEKDILYRI